MNTIITSDTQLSTKKASSPFARGAIIAGKRVERWKADEQWIDQPLRWRKSRRIFVCAHGDLFHEAVPDEWIDRVFAVMALAPHHTFQVLTKRPERAREYIAKVDTHNRPRYWTDAVLMAATGCWNTGERRANDWPLPNVWLGTSIEDQATADARIPHLLATPAAVRFVSAEPLLGPVNLTRVGTLESCTAALPRVVYTETKGIAPHPVCGFQIDALGSPWQATAYFQTTDHMGGFAIGSRRWPRLDWVIVGGESGPNARPMHPDWARSLRDQCQDAGIPFFFKQWGEWAPDYPWPGSATETTQRAFWHDSCGLIFDTPAQEDGLSFFSDGHVLRVGKQAAGRQLDGRTWDQSPEVRHG